MWRATVPARPSAIPSRVKALTTVFRKATDAVQTIPIGTVKSNVAHLLGASGLAGIAKVLAQLKHGKLAPSLHAETLNPDIPFEHVSLLRPARTGRMDAPHRCGRHRTAPPRGRHVDWRRRHELAYRHRGGAHSHGLAGGRKAPSYWIFSRPHPRSGSGPYWTVSRSHLRDRPDERLADIAFTLQVGKNELSSRLAIVAGSRDAALAAIDRFLATGRGRRRHGLSGRRSSIATRRPTARALDADCAERRLGRIAEAWCRGRRHRLGPRQPGPACAPASPCRPIRSRRCAAGIARSPTRRRWCAPSGPARNSHPFIGVNRSDAAGLRFETNIHLSELRDYVFAAAGRDTVLPLAAVDALAAAASIGRPFGPPGPPSDTDKRGGKLGGNRIIRCPD